MKNKNISIRAWLLAAFAVLALHAGAQDYIDENYLGNLEANARLLLAEPSAPFKENASPAKWNDESAVVLAYSRDILLDRQSRGGFLTRRERSLWFREKDHFKIRLNDNNAVQAFSEIYFRYGAKDDGFSARIIKPDGTIRALGLNAAVAVERNGNVPEYFRSFFDKVAFSQYQYYKVPVADLEPGDVFEYVATTKSKLDVTSSGFVEFAPVYEVCSKKYPVLYNEIAIETDDKTFFKYLSLNGAPEFHKESSSEPGFYRYVFVDHDRGTEKDVNFVSPLLKYPLVKFQVIYANNDQAKGALIGAKGELKSGFAREELARKAWEDYQMAGDGDYAETLRLKNFAALCYLELQRSGESDWTDSQYVSHAYYLLRDKVVFRDTYFSDRTFAYLFNYLLGKRDIQSDLIISIGNNIGRMKDVLFDDEIRYIVRVGDRYYFNTTDFSNPGELEENLLDNEAYLIREPNKKSGQQEITPIQLPGTRPADNTEDVYIKSQLTADMKSLQVIRTTSYTGIQKARSISNELRYTTYMIDDYKHYGGKSPTDKLRGRELEQYNTSVQAMKDEFARQKNEAVKAALEAEYNQPVNNIHYSLVSDGRNQRNATLVVKEGFEIQDAVRRAGRKYMINLPGLVGEQLQIKKDERERKYDIDVRFPKTYSWTIEFKIPEGYTVAGLSELNRSVENETGTFSLAAREENGAVILKVLKVYKQKLTAPEKWKDMLTFLDAAYNSSFRYVLLVPKQ